jgi:hypothetical protein
MNSYQKLKKRIEFLEYIVKKNDSELEYLSQNVDLTLDSKVSAILLPYRLRSNLKKQIETFFFSGDVGEVGGISEKENNTDEKFILKSNGIITKFNKLDQDA